MTSPLILPEPIRANDVPDEESVLLLLYGASGCGKTRFCISGGDRTLIINTGNGLATLGSPDVKKLGNPLIVNVFEEYDPKTGIFKTAKAFDMVCDILDKYITDPNIDTICIDDATFLNKLANNKALEINNAESKSKSLLASSKHGLIMMAVQDWGTQMNIIDWFLATYTPQFKKAGKHFILTAHERLTFKKGEKIGDAPELIKVTPGFVGQTFPDNVPAYFDWVWHAESVSGGESIRYRFRTVGDETLIAKTRQGGVFPVLVSDCNFLNLLKTLKGANK
jgi:hypothetical protein